jgi:rRNA pseudouridine-1189 N-methylase Emg1 (Nep1/Mra1 family)
MADTVGAFEVERDVSTGQHQVTVYVGGVAHEMTAFEAQNLADIVRLHAEPATCWQCGNRPSMPGDLCPRCQDAEVRR